MFLPGIGIKKEQQLWKLGVKDWADFLKVEKIIGISDQRKKRYDLLLREAQTALHQENFSYFNHFPSTETWRLYSLLKDEACFLDIEIDSYGDVTVVGISNYFTTNFFVRGFNLDARMLEKELEKYKLVITFNGSSFDLPKLLNQFQLKILKPHIDLKPLCLNLGLQGGLKEIEKQLELKRPAHLYGNPVELWKAFHASGDREYLDLLLEYNREDIENLRAVMEYCYKQKMQQIYK